MAAATHIVTHKRLYTGPNLKHVPPGTRLELTAKQAKKMGNKVMAIGDEVPLDLNQINATDAAVALAEENGIDLATVNGTGNNGRIGKPDVQAAIDSA